MIGVDSSPGVKLWMSMCVAWSCLACAGTPPPQSVEQAKTVSESEAARSSQELAPQATAAARKLIAQAESLYEDGQGDKAAIVGEQAIAAFEEAFVLTRAARAKQRVDEAQRRLATAERRLLELDARQERLAREADMLEMRARVALDREEVADVESLTPARARARRQAAIQLASEAALLCQSAGLLTEKLDGLNAAQEKLAELREQLGYGSARKDMYPRATAARSRCLSLLTRARKPVVQAKPAGGQSDQLLEELTETGKLFAFRDDRGVVVNIAEPVTEQGELTQPARELVDLLAGTARAHEEFPVLVVSHAARRMDETGTDAAGQQFAAALERAGAPRVEVTTAGDDQPVVDRRVRGASERNSRIEVVFVAPGR